MVKIEKLLRKISKKERERLLAIVEKLIRGETKGLNVRKIKDSDFYRLRSGRFRIILHFQKKEIIIDSIRLKSKSVYKRLR